MLLKKRMHPRNIYNSPPNFKELAVQYPEFRNYVKTDLSGKVSIDYQDKNAVKELTRILLKKDFNLNVTIDETRLIPRVPVSLNYILWIEDLLTSLDLETQPIGIDIGTGCVCIYSLLGARRGWKMLATEMDPENFKLAEENVKQNKLNGVISVKLVENSNNLLIGVVNDNEQYEFCMCNPPFFNFNEKPQNRTSRRPQMEIPPTEVSTEMSTEGGEVAFISKLISESVKLQDKVKIYTTLIGKKADFLYLKKDIQKVSPKSVAFTEFCQGRTTRWGLAWTFLDVELKEKLNEKKKKNKSKPPLQYTLPSNVAESLDSAFGDLKKVLQDLKISFKEDEDYTLHFQAYENTWSHQRRKKRQQAREEEPETSQSTAEIEEEECSQAKRQKLDLLVEAVASLKNIDFSIVLELFWLSGDKEILHQIFQYFKNYFTKKSSN